MTKEFKTKEIKGAKTIAQKLISARKKMGKSLLDAEQDTNIRLKYLEAFENNIFEDFPSEVYALGFLRRYSAYLGLDPKAIISQYKIEWNAAQTLLPEEKKTGFGPKSSMPRFNFTITPKTIAALAVAIVVLSLLGYIWWAVKKFSAPPSLMLTKPKAEDVITDDKILIEGKTDPGTYIYINNEPIDVNPNGKFSQEINLGEGVSTLQIVAKNRLDRENVHVIKIVDEQEPNNASPAINGK